MSSNSIARIAASAIFDEAVLRSGHSIARLIEQLKLELGRDSLSPQTVKAWRNGDQAVPFEALLVVSKAARLRPSDVVDMVLDRLATLNPRLDHIQEVEMFMRSVWKKERASD